MSRHYSTVDTAIVAGQRFLETCFASPAGTGRPRPGRMNRDTEMTAEHKRRSAQLMRVNHVGEVCAQALYQGQALTCRDAKLKVHLSHAAEEENDHLRWCSDRLVDLGSHKSYLNPVWYTGALGIGVIAGFCGDKWNLGFLAETEHQVVAHIERHLEKLPSEDTASQEILRQMREDELGHAHTAISAGGVPLPWPVPTVMKIVSRVMTFTARYI